MPRGTNSANPIWKFFYENREEKLAKCKICSGFYSYTSTTNNLKSHLKRKHGFNNNDLTKDLENVLEQLPNAETDPENTESSFIPKRRKNASVLWTVFKKIEKFTAKCRLCDQNVRFKGTTGNLSVHLKRYHHDAVEKIKEAGAGNDDQNLDSEEENDSLHQQDVYFEEEDDQVKCTVCGKVISEDGEDPRGHLEEHHPGLLARIIKDEDRAEEEAEKEEETQNEKDVFTEVVYLDQIVSPQTPKRPAQTKKLTTEIVKKRKLSTISDEYLIKTKKTKEIESFTNYIRILLEKLPQDVCSRLQLEIINLIMGAQFNLPSNSTTSAVASTGMAMAVDKN